MTSFLDIYQGPRYSLVTFLKAATTGTALSLEVVVITMLKHLTTC